MKFISTLAITLIAAAPALAAPQASGTVKDVATATVSLTPVQTCLNTCDAADVNCQASCLGTAHPNESQVNQTTECAGKCDQGDGSPEATQKYSDCVQSCIASYFPTTQTVAGNAGTVVGAATNAATATGSAAAGTGSAASGATATGTGASKATGASSSASGTAAAASSSSTGAASNLVASSAFGLAGVFAAIFAL